MKELPKQKASRNNLPPLSEFIPLASPRLETPHHLEPIIHAIEVAASGKKPTRVVISTPPQHGKTEAIKHGLIWAMLRNPGLRCAYISYAADRAKAISRQIQGIAAALGYKITGNASLWSLPNGSSLAATGILGQLTGYGFDGIVVIDDPVKNRAEAESSTYRNRIWEGYLSDIDSRLHPSASLLCVMTRWHPDDLAGRLIGEGVRRINLPAISEDGKALWYKRPIDWLLAKEKRLSAYVWSSLWQGSPRPRGGRVFEDAHLYEVLPHNNDVSYSIGFDLAYTKKKHSDFSVAVRMAEYGGIYYVAGMMRMQGDVSRFANSLLEFRDETPDQPTPFGFIGGTEQGIVDLISKLSLDLDTQPATDDKFIRAQPLSAAWKDGRVLVPHHSTRNDDEDWVDAFISEVTNFTGVNDDHDDIVDATAAAYYALQNRNIGGFDARFCLPGSF